MLIIQLFVMHGLASSHAAYLRSAIMSDVCLPAELLFLVNDARRPCIKFMLGECMKGATCTARHDPSNLCQTC